MYLYKLADDKKQSEDRIRTALLLQMQGQDQSLKNWYSSPQWQASGLGLLAYNPWDPWGQR